MNVIVSGRPPKHPGRRAGLLLLLLSASLFGCAQQPTKIYNAEDINTQVLAEALKQPIEVTEQTVLIDARAPFEYAMTHAHGAVNVKWTDFADLNGPYPGKMKASPDEDVRRLALLGISPNTPVVILGEALNGRGEEGRLAWSLLYLGVFNVQTAGAFSLPLRYGNLVSPPRANASAWEPALRESVRSSKAELIKTATAPQTNGVHILDVRSKDEYFSKNRKLQYEVPDLRAVNIEWKQFYTAQGRPNPSIRKELEAIGIHRDDRVIVISNEGMRSGAVTYALLALGYKNAANFDGGYTELLGLKRK